MIYTFTPNPAIDYYTDTPDFRYGEINHSIGADYRAGGKGINVSLALNALEIPSVAIYFSGGSFGRIIGEQLEKYPFITACPVETEESTRLNIKFVGNSDTAINAPGPFISEKAKQQMRKILSVLKEDDYLIISGSLPKNVDMEYICSLCRMVSGNGGRIVLDTSAALQQDFEDLDVFLIKPNLEEFIHMFPQEEVNENNFPEYMKRLNEKGVKNILLSMGAKGSYYRGEAGEYRIEVPKVEVYSTVAAGDTTLGVFIGMYLKTGDMEKALVYANAAGSIRVSTGNFELKTTEDIISNIKLKKIG